MSDQPARSRFCINCGAKHVGGKFCGACGKPYAAQAATGPTAVIPRSVVPGASRSSQSASSPRSSSEAPRPRTVSAPPITINVGGQQASATPYYGRTGYRCAGCNSFLYDGGPNCGCGYGYGNFLATGLEVVAFEQLFSGDVGDAAADFMLAGALSGGGIGYAGMGDVLGEVLLLDAVERVSDDDRDSDDDSDSDRDGDRDGEGEDDSDQDDADVEDEPDDESDDSGYDSGDDGSDW